MTQDRDDASAEQAGDDALAEAFWAVARQLRERSQETLAPWDITPAHLRALRTLRRHGTMRLSELSDHLHIAPRSTTEVVDALEARDLVRRRADPGDRRATLVEVTEHGAEILAAIRDTRGAEAGRVFGRLGPADRAELARILTLLRDPAMTPVRIGLAGYGRGGRFFHAPLIGLAPECTLAGVLTRSPQRRAELAGDFPGLPVAGRLAELAAAGIDAVVISTPLDTHEALVREAIALGLPVVCDKPFTPDAASARALVDEAERSGVPLTVYQNRRWDADFRTVRELVESGTLGEVTGFESRMEQYPPPGGFSATGGGVLRDFGSHVADQALHLFGPAAAVYAEVHVRPEDGFDDRFFLSVRHAGGVTSHLRGDWTLHGAPGPRFRVTGRTGTFAVESDDGQSERLLSGEAAEPGPFGTLPFGTVPEARWGRIYRGESVPPEPVPAQPGRWSSFYSAFARAVRGEGALPVDPRDAVAALEVLDAARRSAARGEVVRLSRAA